jgi:hypothetical protein
VRTKEVSRDRIQEITLKLLDYCKRHDWTGYDPYDALNSKLLRFLPFLDFKLFRIGLTQLLKRSPINIRSLLLVPKMQNPKALALFLMAFVKLEKLGLLKDKDLIPLMVQRLIDRRSPQELSTKNPAPRTQHPTKPYWCWGYSFPWQTRMILVPRWAPNLVCTTFVANALMDAYGTTGDSRCLDMAVNAAAYMLNELYWTDADGTACLAYPLPTSRARVHNANFLGAALLCRVHKRTGDREYLDPALKVARYSASKQRKDGSWEYGEHATQKWIDNFHTGFNLCALKAICEYAETSEFEPHIRRGLEFYQMHFFEGDGAPKYFHNRIYPIDTHAVAQSLITLVTLGSSRSGGAELAKSVFEWAVENMWDEKGFFYYQKYPALTIKTSYMRWTQAWMLYALATFLCYGENKEKSWTGSTG